jgi:hypothetical protein
MNYCSLEDAYQIMGNAPSPGCNTDYSTKIARKEERKRARKCKGPPATFFNTTPVADDEPDGVYTNDTGLKAHTPATKQYAMEPYSSDIKTATGIGTDLDVIRARKKKQADFFLPEVQNDSGKPDTDTNTEINYTAPVMTDTIRKKKFFGASPEDDTFADYDPDKGDYKLEPEFTKAFSGSGVGRAGSNTHAAILPIPSVDMYWKPNMMSGAQTAFIEKLPPPGGEYARDTTDYGDISMKDVMKKMDKIFARLDDMNSASSPEQTTSELMMFISSGIFVLFMMDLLVKHGNKFR